MNNEKSVLLKFNILQVSYWWSFACMPAFISAYLLSLGLSNTQLSLLLATFMFFAFLGQFFWGSICDKLKTNKKVFILGNLIVLVLDILIYFLAGNLLIIFVLYPLLGFTMVPLPSNLDTWLLKCFSHRPNVYGPARGWAAVGFSLFMLLYGNLINSVGFWVMPVFACVLILTTVTVAFTQPDAPMPEEKRSAFKVRDIGRLTKIRPYMFLIILLLLTGLSIAPINNMKIAVLKGVGGNVSHQGYDSFFMCLFQIPFFFFSGRIRLIPRKIRLAMAAAGPIIMILLNLLAVSPYMVIAGSVFNAVSFSIMLPTMREITEESVEISLRTTAHGVTDAAFQSLAGMISLLYVGAVMDNFSLKAVYVICLFIQIIPFSMTLISLFGKRKTAKMEP